MTATTIPLLREINRLSEQLSGIVAKANATIPGGFFKYDLSGFEQQLNAMRDWCDGVADEYEKGWVSGEDDPDCEETYRRKLEEDYDG